MCFAPSADVAVGTVVVIVGVDALRSVRRPAQLVLGVLPLLFGLHQLTEAFVWWGLQGDVPRSVGRLALWAYLLFAFGALPALVPLAIGLVERSRQRRWIIGVCGVLGIIVAIVLTVPLFGGPIGAAIEGRHIAYRVEALGEGGQWTGVYVVATCGALLASSYRHLVALGVFNLVVIPVLAWLTLDAFVSLWCFWAAVVSIVIATHLRRLASPRAQPATQPVV